MGLARFIMTGLTVVISVLLVAIVPPVRALVKEMASDPLYTFCIKNVERARGNFTAGIKGSEELADWFCIQKVLWRTDHSRGVMARLTDAQRQWIISLFNRIESDFMKSLSFPGSTQRVRQEFRTLTTEQRIDFAEAVKFLKADTSVPPNKYDVFVLMHNGVISGPARFGPGFYGHNRLMMLLFETALREVMPGITLPYWDMTIEGRLADPRESTFWSDQLMGSGEGPVLTGPFRNWQTVDGSLLTRNLGTGGRLFSNLDIERMCFKSKLEEVSEPFAPTSSVFERTQSQVHLYVGGEMRDFFSAPNDPLFFLYYAFIDCIWQQFREHQTSVNINPETDYPAFYGTAAHAPDFPVFRDFLITNREALKDKYGSRLYRCAPRPRCVSDLSCGSSFLTCNFATLNCEPTTRELGNFCPNHGTLQRKGYQNSYCVNGICDTDQWAYMPIQVVYGRPPDFTTYNSHPYDNGQPNFSEDIYDPKCYKESGLFTSRVNRHLDTPEYTDCDCKTRGINHGGVYLQSHGINDPYSYREYVVVDRRQAVSSSVGIVAVKKPVGGESLAFIRAYDDCGRICRPVCHMPNTDWYETCTGVVKVSSVAPLEYFNSYEDVYLDLWDFSRGPFIPVIQTDNIRLTFYCDFSGAWPWMFYQPAPPMSATPAPITTVVPTLIGSDGTRTEADHTAPITTTTFTIRRPTTTTTTTTRRPTTTITTTTRRPTTTTTTTTRRPTTTTATTTPRQQQRRTTTTTTTARIITTRPPPPTTRRTTLRIFRPTTTRAPTTTTTPAPTTTIFVDPDCFIPDMCYKRKKELNCKKCINNDLVPCPNTCQRFLQCSQGYWAIMDCPAKTSFDQVTRICVFPHHRPLCTLGVMPKYLGFKNE